MASILTYEKLWTENQCECLVVDFSPKLCRRYAKKMSFPQKYFLIGFAEQKK
jgi:hypothetical protein